MAEKRTGPLDEGPYVEKTLALSTGHVPQDMVEKEAIFDPGDMRCTSHQYGWIVFFSTDHQDESIEAAEDWFKPILKTAFRQGCNMVMFDRDASVHPGLEEYTR